MMADPKARALVENFAGQWLQLRNIEQVAPNERTFPDSFSCLGSASSTCQTTTFPSTPRRWLRRDRSPGESIPAKHCRG